jgi:hypothetical protein
LVIFRSKLRQHAGQYLQSKVFFVAKSVGATLKHTDFVVQSFDEAERDFVLGLAVGSDAVLVSLDHVSEIQLGFQTLPFELRSPILEELPGPRLAAVIPQLAEGFLQQVRGVEALVGCEQQLQVLPGAAGEILRMGQQSIFLTLDEGARFALKPAVLARTPMAEVYNEVKRQCQQHNLPAPARDSIIKRIRALDARLAALRRMGAKDAGAMPS